MSRPQFEPRAISPRARKDSQENSPDEWPSFQESWSAYVPMFSMPTSFKSGRIDLGSRIRSPVHSLRQAAHGHSPRRQEIGKRVDTRVGPGDFENLFGLKGTDVGGRIRHSRSLK